jgi:hypothetical protein
MPWLPWSLPKETAPHDPDPSRYEDRRRPAAGRGPTMRPSSVMPLARSTVQVSRRNAASMPPPQLWHLRPGGPTGHRAPVPPRRRSPCGILPQTRPEEGCVCMSPAGASGLRHARCEAAKVKSLRDSMWKQRARRRPSHPCSLGGRPSMAAQRGGRHATHPSPARRCSTAGESARDPCRPNAPPASALGLVAFGSIAGGRPLGRHPGRPRRERLYGRRPVAPRPAPSLSLCAEAAAGRPRTAVALKMLAGLTAGRNETAVPSLSLSRPGQTSGARRRSPGTVAGRTAQGTVF